MASSPRGLALVISNVTFDPPAPDLDRRVGGEVDEEVLRKLFTELDYTVRLHRNLSVQVPEHALKMAPSPKSASHRLGWNCLMEHNKHSLNVRLLFFEECLTVSENAARKGKEFLYTSKAPV